MSTLTMTPPRTDRRHWREVTGPWRRLRDGLFQTRDGRYRALWSDELNAWWLIERHDDGDQWIDTFPRLVDIRHHVSSLLESEEAHADAYMLRHREKTDAYLIEVVHGGETHATVTVQEDGIRTTIARSAFGPMLALTAEFAEALGLALSEAAMTSRALEATRNREED